MRKLSLCEKGYRDWLNEPLRSKPTKTKSAAVLTIHDAPRMTLAGRKRIAQWLQRQARFLVEHNKELNTRFTARYLYKRAIPTPNGARRLRG